MACRKNRAHSEKPWDTFLIIFQKEVFPARVGKSRTRIPAERPLLVRNHWVESNLREYYRFWISIQIITIFGILVYFDLKFTHINFWNPKTTQKKSY